ECREHTHQRHQNRADQHEQRALLDAPSARRDLLLALRNGIMWQQPPIRQQYHCAFHREAAARTKSERVSNLLLAASWAKHRNSLQWSRISLDSLARIPDQTWLWRSPDNGALAPMCP